MGYWHFNQSTLIVAETTKILKGANFLVNSKANIFGGPANGIHRLPVSIVLVHQGDTITVNNRVGVGGISPRGTFAGASQ